MQVSQKIKDFSFILYIDNNNDVASSGEVKKKSKVSVIYILVANSCEHGRVEQKFLIFTFA